VPDVESSDAGSTGMTMRGLHGDGDFVQSILSRDQYEIIET
jgi:hypothetical protein